MLQFVPGARLKGFLRVAFEAAGQRIKTPFPRMSYDQAIRFYGSDKPDRRLPAMTDVRRAFPAENLATLAVNPALPVVAIRVPKVGATHKKNRRRAIRPGGEKVERNQSGALRTLTTVQP